MIPENTEKTSEPWKMYEAVKTLYKQKKTNVVIHNDNERAIYGDSEEIKIIAKHYKDKYRKSFETGSIRKHNIRMSH